MISPILVGGFVEMDRALLYAPYWFEGQGVLWEESLYLPQEKPLFRRNKLQLKE